MPAITATDHRFSFRQTGFVLLLSFMLVSCTGVHSQLKPEYKNLKPVRNASEIEIIYEAPTQKHRIIGELSMEFQKTPYEEVIEKLKEEAARLGADGIILERLHTYQNNWNVSGKQPGYSSTIGSKRKRQSGLIYRYLRE